MFNWSNFVKSMHTKLDVDLKIFQLSSLSPIAQMPVCRLFVFCLFFCYCFSVLSTKHHVLSSRELLSLSVLRCLGRNGPVICLVKVQHYNAVEARTIIVSFKEPYLSQKEGSLFICIHTTMNTYFVGDYS